MSQMNEHHDNGLNMCSITSPTASEHMMFIIMMIHHLQILSRKELVQLLTRYYQFDFLKPILHTVPLIDSTVATMTIFDS